MKLYLICLISTFFGVFSAVDSVIYTPWIHQKHGPLYEGIKLLITDEKFHADLVWNETNYHINETSYLIQETIDEMLGYKVKITEVLEELNKIDHPVEFQQCVKQYEREIAHYNRELLDKYNVCMRNLQTAVDTLKAETSVEITYIQNASKEVGTVAGTCNIVDLKNSSSNHAGIALCVVSRIGRIDQRLFASAQLCLEIISDISFVDGNDSSDSCRSFNDLKKQSEEVLNKIVNCVSEATA